MVFFFIELLFTIFIFIIISCPPQIHGGQELILGSICLTIAYYAKGTPFQGLFGLEYISFAWSAITSK